MESIPDTVLQLLASLFLVGAFLWLAVPVATGLPWVPAREKRIRAALRLANLQPGETVYDLGAGDGRVLVMAAREFGARAVGIEISPVHWFLAFIRVFLSGTGRQVQVRWGNFLNSDLSKADVIFAYVTSGYVARLRPFLEARAKPGARVVTISADLDGWQPEDIDQQELIFLYHMPPTPGDVAAYLAKKMDQSVDV